MQLFIAFTIVFKEICTYEKLENLEDRPVRYHMCMS